MIRDPGSAAQQEQGKKARLLLRRSTLPNIRFLAVHGQRSSKADQKGSSDRQGCGDLTEFLQCIGALGPLRGVRNDREQKFRNNF